jgi:ribosomal subunit interface protein
MQLTVKGKHLDVGDALRAHVESNLSHTAGKYFRNPVDATVIFTKEKGHRYSAHISVHLGSGIVLQAQHEADDPYPAFDIASQRVATRLSRYKDRLRDHHRWDDISEHLQASYTTLQSNENDAEGGNAPVVISEMQTTVPTLAVSDAVMRLELGTLPALMFRNPKSGIFNMVYRRKDGNIGWLEPAPEKKASVSVKKKTALVKKAAARKKPAAKKPSTRKKPAKKKK